MAGGMLTGRLPVFWALLLVAETQQAVKRKVGDDVTLEPRYSGDPSEINWKISNDKVVDMELRPKLDIYFYRLNGRATISPTNGSLTIRNLTIGDSGVYTGEAVVGGAYQDTPITLIVLECPAVPTISDQTTRHRIILLCQSSSPGVTYQWMIGQTSLSNNPLYNESRPAEKVTLTCIVDNEVCKKNASITIHVPDDPFPDWLTAFIIFLVLILILILVAFFIALCYHYREGCMKAIYDFITCKKEARVKFFRKVHSWFPCFKGKETEIQAEQQHLIPVESCCYITVKFQTEGQPGGMGKTRLTIRDVKPEDRDHYRVEVLHSDGLQVFSIKEMNGVVKIEPKDDRVTLTTDMENVTKLTWKNFDVPLFDWTVSGLKFHTNNISVEAGSVAVNDALGKETYRVNVHSTANNTVQEEGRLESQPIGSITFHPINMANKAEINWEKDDKVMDGEDKRIKYGPNGDLTINNVTSEDKGRYSVQCGDRNLEQVFFLDL